MEAVVKQIPVPRGITCALVVNALDNGAASDSRLLSTLAASVRLCEEILRRDRRLSATKFRINTMREILLRFEASDGYKGRGARLFEIVAPRLKSSRDYAALVDACVNVVIPLNDHLKRCSLSERISVALWLRKFLGKPREQAFL